MVYICLSEGVAKRRLLPLEHDYRPELKPELDYYQGIFYYNQEQFEQFKKTHSTSGINELWTDRLVWDFDSTTDLEAAAQDAATLCERLIDKGVVAKDIQIAFSGMKGFSVEIKTDKRLTQPEFSAINIAMAEGLETNDKKILDAQRIFRIVGTKHQKSGLYKYPLTLEQLKFSPIEEIKELAKDINNAPGFDWNDVSLPDSVYGLRATRIPTVVTPVVIEGTEDLDYANKPKGFSNCKFALMNGFFEAGERDNSLLALAATCRGLGYPKEISFAMCKAAARLQGKRTATDPYSKEEIWSKHIERVYSETWRGAVYSCRTQPWLKDLCDRLGPHKCKHDAHEQLIQIEGMAGQYEAFNKDIVKNTITTGIEALDKNITLTVGMPVALLGAPSSGKTSLALDILANTSESGINAIFFSMDMYGPLIFAKQIQRYYGYDFKKVSDIFLNNRPEKEEIKRKVSEKYSRVKFSTKAGHTVSEMRDILNDYQEKTGEKVKLIVIDYLECISGPYSDPTANSAKIAGELRDFATEMSVCNVTLVQPPKVAGDASYPLTSMRQIKGSSLLEQSFRAIFGIYRDGFGPNNPEDDRFLTINCLKNTMGPLFSVDNKWQGSHCQISPLDDEGQNELADLRRRKAEKKSAEGSSW
jgi:hypothetical protein